MFFSFRDGTNLDGTNATHVLGVLVVCERSPLGADVHNSLNLAFVCLFVYLFVSIEKNLSEEHIEKVVSLTDRQLPGRTESISCRLLGDLRREWRLDATRISTGHSVYIHKIIPGDFISTAVTSFD